MDGNGYKFEGLEEFVKMTSVISARIKSQFGSSVFNLEGLSKALQNVVPDNIKPIANYDSIIGMSEMLSKTMATLSRLQIEQLQQLSEIDFSRIFSSTFIGSDSFKSSVSTAYEILQEELNEADTETYNTSESDFSNTEELEEAINEHICNPKGFQERFANWSKDKIIKYYIIWQIICFLWSNFGQPYFQENVGIPVTAYMVSKVRELPEKGAEVICQLKENIEAIIIENTNYYYKISFTDEDGIEREGYVAKKNLRLLKEEEGIEEETNEQK